MPTSIPPHWRKVVSKQQFFTFKSWLTKLEAGEPIPANMSADELRWSTTDVDIQALPCRVTKPKRRQAA